MTTDTRSSDRDEIASLLVRYASGIDRRDWDRFRTCFTADCDVDYGDIGTWHSVDEITDWMTATHEPCGPTMHRITNIDIELAPDDDDRASARAYVDALILMPDGASGAHAMGFYEDDVVRTADGWRIARRRYTMVLLESVGDGVAL